MKPQVGLPAPERNNVTQTQTPPQKVVGTVKWFDVHKGFGFILDPASEGRDILLHINVLRAIGHSSVVENTEIEALVMDTPRGRQVTEILRLTPPATDQAALLRDLGGLEPEALATLPLVPARVKWFDKVKGFGFANAFASPEDIFLHIEVVRHGGFSDLPTGEAILLRVVDGERGRIAAQVLSWDHALPRQDAE